MRNSSSSGFTLTEMLVVGVIIGLLSAVAVPNWLAFVNQRRMSVAQEEILQALQSAQNEAKRVERTTAVQFDLNSDPPLISVNNRWQTLGRGELKAGQLLLTVSSSTFSFNAKGEPVSGQIPFKATVTAPSSKAKRCVVVHTLRGTLQEANGSACD
ncbi:type II secretion system protein [Leptolyngbya sp. FACHB-261]|uniref:type II secretion system protein n=1 Tax=Leptolyngbya sp. FACHB-261 TaxID=2692806 RepID=UPI0016852353|nr:type II secretion system protein [Leptolyngbya sp. FACHB-261]MBD2100368.1 type II secretion system protein [Leptolyngbya sp. FACHB-261]